jgi:acetyltransferase-like isoleucine patch superfamily enzyme
MLKKATSATIQVFNEHIQGENKIISVGDGCRINAIEFTVIGNNCSCVLEDHVSSNAPLEFFIVGNHCSIRVGAFTHFESTTTMQAIEDNMSIDIGTGCLFASAYLVTSDYHNIYSASTGKSINPPKPVIIEGRVWIGKDVTILKGAYIGSGSVVGINSVVTKEFRSKGVIIAGNPAKIVKEDITWGSRIRP